MIKRSYKEIPNEFFHIIGIVALFVLLLCFLLTVIGAIDLTYINNIVLPDIVEIIIDVLLFTIDMVFVTQICLKSKLKVNLLVSIGFIPILLISSAIFISAETTFITSGIVRGIYLIILSLCRKEFNTKETVLRYILYSILIIPNQLIIIFVRAGLFGTVISSQNTNALTSLVLCIDNILMLLFLVKEVDYFVKLLKKFVHFQYSRKWLVSGKRFGRTDEESQSEAPGEIITPMRKFDNKKQALYFYSRFYMIQFMRLGSILLMGKLFNVFYEVIIMLAVFFLCKAVMKDVWHGSSIKECTIATLIGFTLLARLTLPLSVSILFCIALSGLFVFTLDLLGKHFKEIEEIKNSIAELETLLSKRTEFNYKTCSQDDFYNYCLSLGIKPRNIDFAWKSIRLNYSYKELAEEFNYAVESITKKKGNLLKKLNCNLDDI